MPWGHRRGQQCSSTIFLNSALKGGGIVSPPPQSLHSRKEPVSIVKEAEWVSGVVWPDAENLTPKGVGTLDTATYRLRCSGRPVLLCTVVKSSHRKIGAFK